MKPLILLSVIFFYLASVGLDVRAERLPIRVYTSADGLGSSFVSYLIRDSRGFLWVCTRDGLSRFDGARFVTYQVGDNSAAPGIEQILETRQGIYWIVTTGGLYRFDPAGPHRTDSPGDRPILSAEYAGDDRAFLLEDRDGQLWSGSDGLYRRQEKDKKLLSERVELSVPGVANVPLIVRDIVEASDRSLWLSTSWGVIRRARNGAQVLYVTGTSQGYAASMVEDSAGRIWVGRRDYVFVIKPEPLSVSGSFTKNVVDVTKVSRERPHRNGFVNLPQTPGEIIKFSAAIGSVANHNKYVYRTADDHIWISDANQVTEFDGQTFHRHAGAEGVIPESSMMVEDASGNLWFGSPKSLVRLNHGGLTSYGPGDGLRETHVQAIGETADRKPYFMSGDFLLSVFEQNAFQGVRPGLPPAIEALWTANPGFQDSTGEWWFLTRGKLYRFAATSDIRTLVQQRPRSYDHRDGLKGDHMFHMFEDSRRDLWISTQAPYGLSRYVRATNTFQNFSAADGLPDNNPPSSFAEDKQGNIWIGFYLGGLARYAGGKFTKITADGLPRGLITAVHVDPKGKLWIGSAQSGLACIDDPSALPPRFVSYSTSNGLASNNVRAITADLNGNIFVGTARGVDMISADGTRIKHYSVTDGLAADFVTTAFCDSNGTLWFGTSNGVSRLLPGEQRTPVAPSVWISSVRIAGERHPIPPLGSSEIPLLEMTHSQNNLQLDFFGIDFSAGDNLRYQYSLEGADRDWSAPTLQRAVTYANLAPGSYRFLVRAVNPDGVLSPKPAVFSFTILPPLWQRWWFLLLSMALLMAVLYALYRYRVAQLLKVERVRTRIATDLHDDIGASLSRMAILSEVVKQQAVGGNGKQAAPLLTEIADSARGLIDSMGDIVWSIDPRRDDLQSVVRRIRQFASDVLEAKGIDWELHVPPEVESLKLSAEQRQHLFLIFKEGINNVVRHGKGTKSVSLSIRTEAHELIGQISDDGCGFTPQEPDKARSQGRGGNGLPNMRERAGQLGGRLEITSAPGAGTKLTLRTPIK